MFKGSNCNMASSMDHSPPKYFVLSFTHIPPLWFQKGLRTDYGSAVREKLIVVKTLFTAFKKKNNNLNKLIKWRNEIRIIKLVNSKISEKVNSQNYFFIQYLYIRKLMQLKS